MRHALNPLSFRSPAWIAAMAALLLAAIAQGAESPAAHVDPPVKFGFTKSMFVDLNKADTHAAVKNYAALLAASNDLTVSDAPHVLDDAESVKLAFERGSADIISLTTLEYLELPAGSTHPRMISASIGGTSAEQYVLLVHKDSGIQTVADLKNKRLLIYSSLRGALSPLWLDVLLATNAQNQPAHFFSSITPITKPSRTILPVFFRQADACVVTQNAFRVTCEMNPQVLSRLKVLATSPGLIPSVTCIRADITPRNLERILNAVIDAQHTVSGRQVLTIFQCDRISEIEDKQIDPVRELVATQTRLRNETPPPSATDNQNR